MKQLGHKIIVGKSNVDNLSFVFYLKSGIECYNLKSNNYMLASPKPNINAMKRSFGKRAPVIWKALPHSTVALVSDKLHFSKRSNSCS